MPMEIGAQVKQQQFGEGGGPADDKLISTMDVTDWATLPLCRRVRHQVRPVDTHRLCKNERIDRVKQTTRGSSSKSKLLLSASGDSTSPRM